MAKHIKNPINFFWIGPKVSPIEVLSLRSTLKHNMTPVLWCYKNIEGIPKGVIVKDANCILPKEKIDYYINDLNLPLPSISDLFRYELLDLIGGIYADTDIVFMDNIYNLKEREYFCSTYEYHVGEEASNCLMRVTKKSLVSQFLINESKIRLNNYIIAGNKADYCEFGPFTVQKCARELNVKVLPYDVINPISWRWTNKIIAYKKIDLKFHLKLVFRFLFPFRYENKGYFLTKNTIAMHLCNEMWKIYGLNKFETMNDKCLYERLKKKVDFIE